MSPARVRIFHPKEHSNEPDPDFYSDNTFTFFRPMVAIEWFQNITPSNVKKLRKIYLCVNPVYEPGPDPDFLTAQPADGYKWCQLLNKMATELPGLREVKVYLDSEISFGHWGPGVDVNFARALGRFSKLSKLKIDGYFGKEWPEYLRGKTGLTVWEADGQSAWYLKHLREYQDMLGDLTI